MSKTSYADIELKTQFKRLKIGLNIKRKNYTGVSVVSGINMAKMTFVLSDGPKIFSWEDMAEFRIIFPGDTVLLESGEVTPFIPSVESRINKCNKCGWQDIEIEYIPEVNIGDPRPMCMTQKEDKYVDEYLECKCNRCGYSWENETLDANKEKTK